jgi:hypothetical protein
VSVAAERERLRQEAEFHDELFASGGRPAESFYAINRKSPRSGWDFYCDLLLREARARRAPRILEYGSGIADFRLARDYFADGGVHYFHLFDLLALPFVGRSAARRLLRALARVGGAAFRLAPPLRRHAWYAVLRLAEPV